MAYGLSTRASDSAAAVKRAVLRASGTWGGYQAWRPLDPDTRLDLVEQALKRENRFLDEYPVAL